ncbi:MAG: GYDIA family GHMP kinase [Bacteroidota bacterium]
MFQYVLHIKPRHIAAKNSYRANGKLLLSGEYFILQGAKGLALPTKLGQTLKVKESSGSDIVWKSYRKNGELWFDAKFDLLGIEVIKSSDEEIAKRLRKIIRSAIRNNSDFLSKWKKYTVETYMEFEPEWGLGSSSTLIYNIANWAEANPFHVFFGVENGSGYDIACAGMDQAIIYQLRDDEISYSGTEFNPSFKNQIYFVYRGAKQNSSQEVERFQENGKTDKQLLIEISNITDAMNDAKSIKEFDKLIDKHESILSKELKLPKVKEELFSDYWGSIKSLGAWGGDFVMVTSTEGDEKTKSYFNQKGLNICFKYEELILS